MWSKIYPSKLSTLRKFQQVSKDSTFMDDNSFEFLKYNVNKSNRKIHNFDIA